MIQLTSLDHPWWRLLSGFDPVDIAFIDSFSEILLPLTDYGRGAFFEYYTTTVGQPKEPLYTVADAALLIPDDPLSLSTSFWKILLESNLLKQSSSHPLPTDGSLFEDM